MTRSTLTRDELSEQIERACERARDLLGAAAPAPDAPLAAHLEALVDQLGDAGEPARQRAHVARIAAAAAAAQRRSESFAAVEAALARLTSATVPATMLTAAPRTVSEASGLDRVVLSSVHDGVMTAQAVHVRGDARDAGALLDALRVAPVRLVRPTVETEMIRRRRATLVNEVDATAHIWMPIIGWTAFATAPIIVRSTVVGVFHADRGTGMAAPDSVDRDVLAAFAAGLARGYERATLRRRLRAERTETREFLERLDARSGALADGPIRLAPRAEDAPAVRSGRSTAATADRGPVDIAVFDGVLTRRELEVLRLVVGGASNRAIADELVISTGTVKFHVNRILGKLRVDNRAGAVARYYALMNVRRP